MKKAAFFAALLCLALGPFPAEAAKFYKWTDEQGVTHYSADPPPASVTASEVKVKGSRRGADKAAGSSTPAAAPAAGKSAASGPAQAGKPVAKAEEKKEAPKGPEQYAEKCKALRGNLQAMEEHAQVKETDDKGEVRVLTSEEKDARLDATNRQIKAFCE